MENKKKLTDEQAMETMLAWGIPIVKSVLAALKTENPAKSLGAIINTLHADSADHVCVIASCIGAIAGLMMTMEDTNESA